MNKSLLIQKINNLPAKKRLEAILEDDDPSALLAAMPAQNILLTIREVGAEDALGLLELLSAEHVQEILDLEIWNNDDLNLEKAGYYFSLLFEANPDRAVEQLDGVDIELLGLMYKTISHIYDQTLGEEPQDFSSLYSQSPDGRFLVCFSDDPTKARLSKALYEYLDSLYARDMKKALSLLEHLRFELASGLEASSHKWRNNRLLDTMGILPREERLEYFSPLNLSALKQKAPPSTLLLNPENSQNQLPMHKIASHIGDRYAFLKQAISDSRIEEKQIFFDALAHASLNMHASWSGDFGDQEEMITSAEYVKTLCEYGLAQATQGQLDRSTNILRNYGIKILIRLGRTALVNLRKLLVTNDESFLFGDDFAYADTPLREVARALKLSEPRFYEGLLDVTKFEVRFFGTLLELNASLKAVHELRFRAQFLGPRVVGITPAMLKNYPSLSHAHIYARYLLNTYLKNSDTLSRLDYAVITHVNKPDFETWSKELTDKLAQKMAANCHYDLAQAQERAAHFLSALLIQLEQNPELLVG